MEQLRLRFLGRTSVLLEDEERVDELPGKALALLSYLAVTAEPQSRSALAGLLWSDFPEHRARSNLRDMLTILRRTRLAPYLDIGRRTIALNNDSPHWLDTAEFQETLTQHHTDGELDPASLEAAVALYQGDFLAGFTIPKAALFEEWQTVQSQQLHLQAIEALGRLVDCYLDSGDYQAALSYAHRLLILDPWREEAHRNVMLLLMLTGDPNAALQQYEHCCEILAAELGVDPSPETETLYLNIRKQMDGQGMDGKIRQMPGALARTITALPGQVTPYFGRDREQRAIDLVLSDCRGRLITIFGVGGSGKTRLALVVGEKQAQTIERDGDFRFPDGVFFAALETVESVAEIAPALCQALGFQPADESQTGRSTETQLLDHLRRKRLLLIIDNFEQLLDGVGLLARIHRSAPQVHLLVTSRQKLSLQGERLYALEGLLYPQAGDEIADPQQLLSNYPAAALFVSGARRVSAGYQLQEDEVPSLIRLCRLVDGLPLALELAAGWTNLLSTADILLEVEQGLSFLQSDLHDIPDRHRSMEAVFDVTWRRLPESEQAIFARLCVFRGGFTRAGAAQVARASLLQLATLANKALIEFDKKHDRYQIHRLLHQFGTVSLAHDSLVERKTRDRHCVCFCDALQQWDGQIKGSGQLQALAELDKESANARAAWNHASRAGKIVELDAAADGLNRFYLWRRRFRAGEAACKLAQESLSELLSAGDGSEEKDVDLKRVLAKILIWRSVFSERAQANGLVSQALETLESAQLAAVDTRRERAFALQRAGDLAFDNNREAARQFYERSLALYRDLDDPWGTAKLLTALGWVAAHRAEAEEAQQLGEEAVALIRAGGDRKRMADALWLLGTLAILAGQFEASDRLLSESLEIRQALGDRITDIVAGPLDLGMTLTWIGRMVEADAVREEALALYEAQGRPEQIALAHVRLATSKFHIGELEVARRHARIGLEMCHEVGNQHGAAVALWILGGFALVMGRLDQAQLYQDECLARFQEIGGAGESGWALSQIAEIARQRGQQDTARQLLKQSLRAASGLLGMVTAVLNLVIYLNILLDEGREAEAAELGVMLNKLPVCGNSAAIQATFARPVAEILAGLPPDVASQALARGQVRNLQQTTAEVLAELEGTVQV